MIAMIEPILFASIVFAPTKQNKNDSPRIKCIDCFDEDGNQAFIQEGDKAVRVEGEDEANPDGELELGPWYQFENGWKVSSSFLYSQAYNFKVEIAEDDFRRLSDFNENLGLGPWGEAL